MGMIRRSQTAPISGTSGCDLAAALAEESVSPRLLNAVQKIISAGAYGQDHRGEGFRSGVRYQGSRKTCLVLNQRHVLTPPYPTL